MDNIRQESKLIRNITLGPLLGIAYGAVIGAGIMTMTGTAIGLTGTGVFLAYIVSAICTSFTSFPSALLGATLPCTGGEYRYISRLVGKELGVVFLALYMVGNLTIALYALSCASYIAAFLTGVPENVIAMIVLIVTFLINMMGTKNSAMVTTAITILLLIGLGMFLYFGFPLVDFDFVFKPSNIFNNGGLGFLKAVALLSFATGGAQVIGHMGSEIVDPHKNIPKVIIFTTLSVGVLDALVAIVAVGVLPLAAVAGENLSLVAHKIMPNWAYTFFIIAGGAGATAKTLNVTLSWVSKPILVACDDGILPKKLGLVNLRGVPVYILFIFLVIGMVPLMLGIDINIISKTGTAIILVSKILFSYAFLYLPIKYKDEFENSYLKISRRGVKLLGIGSIILNFVFSFSLIIDLPIQAIILFAVVFVLAISYVTFSSNLKKIVILDDLAVDYTSR